MISIKSYSIKSQTNYFGKEMPFCTLKWLKPPHLLSLNKNASFYQKIIENFHSTQTFSMTVSKVCNIHMLP